MLSDMKASSLSSPQRKSAGLHIACPLRTGIEDAVRHQATADTLATAELLLRLWPAASKKRCATFAALSELDKHQRWLRG